MIIIKLKDGSDWFKANWVFRQFAADVIAAFPRNSELNLELEKTQAFGSLSLNTMEPNSAAATLKAIGKMAEDTIQGKIHGWNGKRPEDKQGQKICLGAISELLDLVQKEMGEN
jgi:hypothetical protein